jgi:signal transduction histidine kinase/CheY-like chemotaxis protein
MLACVVSFLGIWFNTFHSIGLWKHFLPILILLVFGVFYYFARVKKRFKTGLIGFCVGCVVFFCINWFLMAGITGVSLYFFGTVLICILLIQDEKSPWVFLGGLFFLETCLIAAHYFSPDWVYPYVSREEQFFDIWVFCLISQLMSALTILYSKKSYLDEKNKAEKLALEKSNFLANMSHEIRTPLNGIIGMNEIAIELSNSPQVTKQLNIVQDSAQHLLHIINEVLDISKLNSKNFSLNLNWVSLKKGLEIVFHYLQSQSEKKGIQASFVFDDTLNQQAYIDLPRLRQVLLNLCSNAVKFTENGHISLIVEDRDGSVFIGVKDTGVGMSPKHSKRVFNRYEQVESNDGLYTNGTGLGLSISRKIVEFMEGELEVITNVGQGSFFFFTVQFPRKKMDVSQEIPKVSVEKRSGSGYKILLAEDNHINAKIVINLLQKHNFEVVWVENGSLVLEGIVRESFDLILMDLEMPELNGFETNREIRKQDCTIPIIALTAHALPEFKQKAESQGFSGFLSKPIKRQDLLDTLFQNLLPKNI